MVCQYCPSIDFLEISTIPSRHLSQRTHRWRDDAVRSLRDLRETTNPPPVDKRQARIGSRRCFSIPRVHQLRIAIRPSDQVLRAIVKRGIHGLLWGLRVHVHHNRNAKGEDRNGYVEHY